MNRTLLLPTLLLLAIALASFALSRGAGDADRPLIFCNADDVKTLDPGTMSWANDIRTAMGMWEGLTSYEPLTLEPRPGVAEKWDVSPDGRTYTFHLRPDARWSNGEPVLARDFLFAWRRVLTPATAADYVTLFFVIRGAEDYYNALEKKAPADFASVGIRADNDHTITVELASPCGYFLDLLAFPPFFPLHEKSMEPFRVAPGSTQFHARWMRPPGVVTNGAYRFVDWQFKRALTFEPNEHYWDRPSVKSRRLIIKSIDDQRTALLAYQQGQVDALSFVPDSFGELLLKDQRDGKRHDIHYRPVFGTYYYIFNCQRAPFTDKRVRKALALAIDKNRIVREVTRMGQTPLDVLVPPDAIPGYRSPAGAAMDVEQARRLLAEAGFPAGKGFPVTEILYNNEAVAHGKIAQAIGQMWQQNLGVHVAFRGVERSSFGTNRRQRDFMIARGGWYGDYRDPTTWLDLAKTGDGNNDGQFSSPAYDALLRQAAAEPDNARRLALLTDAERMLVEDEFPFIPLYQYSDGNIFDPRKIGGLEPNLRLLTQFKYVHRK